MTNRKSIYGGSLYIAELQHAKYLPLIQEHISGHVLDIGCGPVPYHEVYGARTTASTCVDWGQSVHGTELLDHFVDLNAPGPLPFGDAQFDSIVASDMIVHLTRPHVFMKELERIMKPGGKAFLSSPFVYWMGEYPHEYFHPSEFALRHLAIEAGFEVVHVSSYGGHADVLMDALNKFFPHGIGNRLFLAFAKAMRWTGWPKRNRRRTDGRYAMGYAMVVRKP